MSNKSLIKNLTISVAQKSHYCHSSKKHRINMGDKRLAVKEGRSVSHYCRDCAVKFLALDKDKLSLLESEL